jgi:AcrR family transcriptional regulator
VPRSEEANQQVREAQRARILDAARTVFASKGLAATMADIAAAAGVSQGLAYRYFASKEELVRELVAEAMRAAPSGDPEHDTVGTPGQRLDGFLTKLIEARRSHREFFQLIHHVAADPDTPKDLLLQMMARGRQFVTMLRRMIVEAQASGEVAPDDPDQLVTAIVASLDGLTRLPRHLPDGSRSRFPGTDIILRMLKPPARREDA